MRGDAPAVRGYTPNERAEIEAAVTAAGLSARIAMMLAPLADWEMVFEELSPGSFDESAKHEAEIRELIARLDELLQPLIVDEETAERFGADPRGTIYDAIRPAIMKISKLTAGHEASARETAALLRDARGRPKKPYQEALQRGLAEVWIHLGGTVDGGKAYRRFFEAAARPIYASTFGKERGLHWSSNTFPDHVRAWRENRP